MRRATCDLPDALPGCLRPVQWVQRPVLPVSHLFCCFTPARGLIVHACADPERIDVSTSSALKAPEVPAPTTAAASTSAARAPASASSVARAPPAKSAGHLLSEGTFKGKYTLGATIGKGSFGEVHKATRKTDGKMCVGVEGSDPQTGAGCSKDQCLLYSVAVKVMSKIAFATPQDHEDMINEVRLSPVPQMVLNDQHGVWSNPHIYPAPALRSPSCSESAAAPTCSIFTISLRTRPRSTLSASSVRLPAVFGSARGNAGGCCH